MSITTTVNRIEYTGDGSSVAFAFPYFFFANSEIMVELYDTVTETTSVKVLDTYFSVTGAGDEDLGGTITILPVASVPNPPALTDTLIIYRTVALKQESDYVDYNRFPASTVEASLDRLTMITQQLQEEIDRCVIQPVANPIDELALPAPVADKVLGWNNGATALENKTLTITETQYGGTISAGVFSARPGTPDTNDIYVSTDTQQVFVCYATPTWTEIQSTGAFVKPLMLMGG